MKNLLRRSCWPFWRVVRIPWFHLCHHLRHPACPSYFCLLPTYVLGETYEGLCIRGLYVFLWDAEDKVLRVVFGNYPIDFASCLVDPDPLLLPCLLTCASYRSCAGLYVIADLHCVFVVIFAAGKTIVFLFFLIGPPKHHVSQCDDWGGSVPPEVSV